MTQALDGVCQSLVIDVQVKTSPDASVAGSCHSYAFVQKRFAKICRCKAGAYHIKKHEVCFHRRNVNAVMLSEFRSEIASALVIVR